MYFKLRSGSVLNFNNFVFIPTVNTKICMIFIFCFSLKSLLMNHLKLKSKKNKFFQQHYGKNLFASNQINREFRKVAKPGLLY